MDYAEAVDIAKEWCGELTGREGKELDEWFAACAEEAKILERYDDVTNQDTFVKREGTLTPAEMKVLDLIADGFGLETIAYKLEISFHTAKDQLARAKRRLNAKTSPHAVRIAIRTGQLEA